MKKGYWVSLYYEVENQENLNRYAETVTPIIKSFGGIPLIRGGDHKTFEGEDFIRTVVWEFLIIKKLLECKNSREYKAGWDIAKKQQKGICKLLKDLVLNRLGVDTSTDTKLQQNNKDHIFSLIN